MQSDATGTMEENKEMMKNTKVGVKRNPVDEGKILF